MVRNMSVVRWAALLCVVALAVSLALFAWRINPNHLQGDQWRWVKHVLMPYRAGEISLFEALTYEFKVLSHTHVLTLGEFLLNERLLGLDLRAHTVIGVLSIFGVMGLLWKNWARWLGPSSADGQDPERAESRGLQDLWVGFGIVLSASALMTPALTPAFAWSLVTFEFLYLLLAFWLLHGFARDFADGSLRRLIAVMAIVFLLGDAMGSAAVLATMAMAVILAIADRKLLGRAVMYIVSFAVIAGLAALLLTGEVSHSRSSSLDALVYALQNAPKTLSLIFNGIGRGAYVAARGTTVFGLEPREPTFLIGIVVIGLSLVFLALAILRRRLRENTFAILLLGFTAVSLIGVIRLRIEVTDGSIVYAGRYYRFLFPYMIGTALLAFDAWQTRLMAPSGLRTAMTAIFGLLVTAHLSMTLLSSIHVWTHSTGSLDKYFASWDAALLESAMTGSDLYDETNRRCRNDYCDAAIDYLQEHGLASLPQDVDSN